MKLLLCLFKDFTLVKTRNFGSAARPKKCSSVITNRLSYSILHSGNKVLLCEVARTLPNVHAAC
jgi:hypothetical protein